MAGANHLGGGDSDDFDSGSIRGIFHMIVGN
jgi:hypothetical protein